MPSPWTRRPAISTPGGHFWAAGAVSASDTAKWQSGAWSATGNGTDSPAVALAVVPSGILYAVGNFGVMSWDGASWTAAGDGLGSTLSALAADGTTGILYVGGNFADPDTSLTGVAR